MPKKKKSSKDLFYYESGGKVFSISQEELDALEELGLIQRVDDSSADKPSKETNKR